MPKEMVPPQAFSGDVAAPTRVTINTKGGSMTAILRKDLREKLGVVGSQLCAAALEFGSGPAVLLLGDAKIRVLRLGKDRFEVVLGADEGDEIDEITAAFLKLKEAQFKAGDLPLMAPIAADRWQAEAEGWTRAAEAALGRSEPGR